MALQLTRLNVPSLTTDYSAETNAAAQLGKTIAGLPGEWRKAEESAQKRQLLGSLTGGGAMDFNKAGLGLLALGDTQGGAALLTLGQKAKEQERETEWMRNNSGVLGSIGAPAAPTAALGSPAGPASPRGVAVAETDEDVARLEAQAAGGTQFGNRNEPRGLRNNNPGNIESGKFAATVQGFQGSDGRFAQYATPEDGIKAADKLLVSYAGRGLNTVNGIVNRWAPPSENNTGAYAAQVARELGVSPDQPLDMNNWETRQRLIAAKIRVENGKQPYSEDVFQRALNPNWGSQVAQFEGGGQAAPTQTAQGGSEGVYATAPTEALQSFINNPKVPENYKAMMRQELARRSGGQAPVQVAEAPAQPGAPVADMPAQGAASAQFVLPGTTPSQTASIMADNQVQNYLRALDGAPEKFKAGIQKRLELRVEELKNARTEEGRGVDTDLKRAQLEGERRKLAGEVPAPAGYRYKPGTTELEAIPGGPAFEKTPAAEVENRKAAAARAGVTPTDPRYQSYVLTGKTPREDAQPLSATDKKAILEADEGVLAGETAIRALNEAKTLSKQAMSGPTAGIRAKIGNNLPDGWVPDFIASPGASEATANLENTVTANALSQMKSIFGGNPTEGERKILLDIQGSIGQPDNVRQGVYDRAIRAAEARLAFNKQRASELRGGDYYKSPDKQGQAQPQRQPSQTPIQGARQAPDGNFYVPDPNRPGKYLMVQP